MKDLRGKTAVVTGAASGIGRALAFRLAQSGCRVALVDRDEAGVRKVAGTITLGRAGWVSPFIADVSDPERMAALPDEIAEKLGDISLLVNNAGISLHKRFGAMTVEEARRVFDVNFWGAVHGCKFFLPHLQKAPEAHIVNVGSILGITGLPEKTAYAASKAALQGFSNALRAELAGTNVGVTLVLPGPVATNIVSSGRAESPEQQAEEAEFLLKKGILPEIVAEKVVRAVKNNRYRVRVGTMAVILDIAVRALPSSIPSLIGRFSRR